MEYDVLYIYTLCNDQIRVTTTFITSNFYPLFVVRTFKLFPSIYHPFLLTMVPYHATGCQNLFLLSNCDFVPVDQPLANPPPL